MAWPVLPHGFLGAQGDNDTYQIQRSLRFNSADSAYLSRTPASAGNRKTFTWSGWLKLCQIPSSKNQALLFDGNGQDSLYVAKFSNTGSASTYDFQLGVSFNNLSVYYATPLLRDPSAWYHIVYACDTTQATSSNRIKIYLNGSLLTTAYSNYPAQNADGQINTATSHSIGGYSTGYGAMDGYLTEINFIDGQALTPSSFGETDAITGRWKAKAYTGDYGANGFYLNFSDNSGTTATTLGKDSAPISGAHTAANNWTPNNFSVDNITNNGVGNDSLVDSPTNYGTDTGVGGEVRGNYCTLNPLDKLLSPTLVNGNLEATVGDNAEIRVAIYVSFGKWYWEVVPTTMTYSMIGVGVGGATKHWGTTGISYYGFNGNKYVNGTASAYGASYTNNDVIGVALDLDNLQITFYKNNVSQGTITGLTAGSYTPALSAAGNSSVYVANFGQRPFAYTAPSGFKALCTTNLPQPTIQKPSRYMDVVTYTGNGSARSITGLGFSPDLVWIKTRANARSHRLADTVRGAGKELFSNETSAEATNDAGGYVSAFNSDGFTIGTGAGVNNSGETYVAWAWDEAPIAGMDIVSFTAPASGNTTVSHSLGVTPRMIIAKSRNSSTSWTVYHASATTKDQYLFLNTTNAVQTLTDVWGSAAPTSSVFGFNSNNQGASASVIAYLFAEVEGFSKFGSYTGNGSADGPFVWCGFRPRWILLKASSNAGANWHIWDTARNTINPATKEIQPDLSSAEYDDAAYRAIDILSNGFKFRVSAADLNASGWTYIFAAFAESPFKYSRAR